MINSKKDILWIIISIIGSYFGLITMQDYVSIGMLLLAIIFTVFYFIDKKCEDRTLDVVSQLYIENKQIDIEKLSSKRNCNFTQDSLNFFNFYKRKGLIPFDAELTDSNNYSPDTFK